MSSISVSNILPSRTRSGRQTNSGPWNHLTGRCQTPERRPVPVMPTTPTKPRSQSRPRVNKQALDVLCRAAIYLNLLDSAKELYRLQVEYVKGVERERKQEILNLYHDLTVRVHELIRLNSENATLQEIENYSELVGWVSRMSVFNNLVSVL